GGTRMFILCVANVSEPDVDLLPTQYQSVLTDQDREAIRNGDEFFRELSSRTEVKWLARLLRKTSKFQCELQFVSYNDRPFRPYFRCQLLHRPRISLPRSTPLRDDLPGFLRHIYTFIGSYQENDFGYSGGLHPSDGLGSVAESGMWAEPDGDIDPATAIPFLETYSGSQLCYLPDS